MNRLTRLIPALALGLLTSATPPATAADASYSYGECGFDTIRQDDVTGNQFTGTVYAGVALYSTTHGNVVNATVTCEIRVNGSTQFSASAWGSGVVVVASPASYIATDTDWVDLCTVVDYTSDSTPTTVRCGEATTMQFPPQWTIDILDYVFSYVNAAMISYVDPAVCAAFQALAPGTEPVTITPQGDVFLNGELFWDCPPYEYEVPPPPPFPPAPPPIDDVHPGIPTGGGYDTGDAGFLTLVDQAGREVASTCGFVKNGATIEVAGTTATLGADTALVRCRLEDTATGAVLYDDTATANGASASLRGSIGAHEGPVTVCTEGAGTWGTREVTVGLSCRPGEPLS